jgi:phage shock protein PspC (stress-responsive transcriptional regulator)
MNENQASGRPTGDSQAPRRLLRSRDDRVIAGVSGGLAHHFNLDPVIFRVAFVAGAFLGGLGVIVYLALLVAVPEDDGTGQPAPQGGGSRFLVIAAAVALGIFALAVLDGPGWGGWWGPGLFFWIAVAVVAGFLARRLLRDEDSEGRTPDLPTESEPTGSEPTTAVIPTGRRRPSVGRLLGVIALAFAAVTAGSVLALASAWAGAEGHGEAVAAFVIALGVILVIAALVNAPRWRWLIPLALVLAVPLGTVAAADIHFEGGYGDRDYRPTSPAAIPADGYELAVGDLSVDLRGLEWERGEIVHLPARLGLGELKVLVPDRVCVEATTDAKAGLLDIRGSESWGAEVDHDENPASSNAPRLRLDGEVQIGHLEVLDQTEYLERGGDFDEGREFGPRFHGEGNDDDAAEESRAQAACAPIPAKGGSR